jgi:hypothetical protein
VARGFAPQDSLPSTVNVQSVVVFPRVARSQLALRTPLRLTNVESAEWSQRIREAQAELSAPVRFVKLVPSVVFRHVVPGVTKYWQAFFGL